MADIQSRGKSSMTPAVPVSALDRKRPEDQATAAAVAANQRATATLDAVKSPGELTVFIDNMLADLEERFDQMSQEVLNRMNAMGERIDVIETAIQDIVSNHPAPPQPQNGTKATPGSEQIQDRIQSGRDQQRDRRASSSGDESLMLTSAPHGMNDDSGSTIGPGDVSGR